MLPASSDSAQRPSLVGAQGADFHLSDRMSGGIGLMLYCMPRCVKRKNVLRRRRLKSVPWFHGMGLLDSPKSRNGNASLLMVMKGIYDRILGGKYDGRCNPVLEAVRNYTACIFRGIDILY